MGIMDFRKVPDAALPTRLTETSLNATIAHRTFQGYVDPNDAAVLNLSYFDINAADVVGDAILADFPAVDPEDAVLTSLRTVVLEDGMVPASLLPESTGGSVSGTARTVLTLGTGFTKPSWGRDPSYTILLGDAHLAGHMTTGTSSFIVGAVVLTGGVFTSGVKAIASSDTGKVLLKSTATTLEIESILTGSAPTWLSFDGVIV
jgi:hypothetical protein